MTNKEYIDFLIVCNKLDINGIEKYVTKISNSDIDIRQLIKLGLDNGGNLESLFFSLKILIEGFEVRRYLVNTVIQELIKVYYSYIKYNCAYYSNWFFFNMMVNDVGLELKNKDCNIQYELNEHRIIIIEDMIKFHINDKEYSIVFRNYIGFTFYEQDRLIKEGLYGVCLKDNSYKIIDNIKDLKSIDEGGYEIVLVCEDDNNCDDITYKLLGNKYKDG